MPVHTNVELTLVIYVSQVLDRILCNFESDWNVIFPFILSIEITRLRKSFVSRKYVTMPDFNNLGSKNYNNTDNNAI